MYVVGGAHLCELMNLCSIWFWILWRENKNIGNITKEKIISKNVYKGFFKSDFNNSESLPYIQGNILVLWTPVQVNCSLIT